MIEKTRHPLDRITKADIDEAYSKFVDDSCSFEIQLSRYTPQTLWSAQKSFTGNSIDKVSDYMTRLYLKFEITDHIEILKAVYGLTYAAVRSTEDLEVNYGAAKIVYILLKNIKDDVFKKSIEMFFEYPTATRLLSEFVFNGMMCEEPSAVDREWNVAFLQAVSYPDVAQRLDKTKAFASNWNLIAKSYANAYLHSRTNQERKQIEDKIVSACKGMDDICAVHLIVGAVVDLSEAARRPGHDRILHQSVDLITGSVSEVSRATTPEMLMELGINMLMNIGKTPKALLLEAASHRDINLVPNKTNSNYDKLVGLALKRMCA